ncbi:MAG: MATE family efflux transporter [Alkalispirochaeta sp.]
MPRPSMTHDPVAPTLFRLVLPMIPGTMSIVLFNLADTYFVGRLGALPLAAMSFSFPVVLISGGLAMGMGIGTSARVSHELGAGNRAVAAEIATRAHLLAFTLTMALAVTGLLFIDPLFRVMGADATTLPLIREYMVVWFVGLPFVVLPMIGMNVLQSTGDTTIPGMVLTSTVLLNIGLDPLLIFGVGPFPEMGIAGAAWATVIARGSSFIIIFAVIGLRERLITRRLGSWREVATTWGRILKIGVPAAGANILLPISMGVVTRMVSQFGTAAVAGFGAATRIESFALVFTLALSMIVTPFVGQNLGAGKQERIGSGVRVASVFSLAWGAMVLVVFLSAAPPIARAFNNDPAVVTVTVQYLRIVALSYGLLGIVNLAAAAFNGLHTPGRAAAVAATRLFVFLIPLAWTGRALGGLPGLFWGVSVGNVGAGIVAYLWITRRVRSRTPQSAAESHPSSP